MSKRRNNRKLFRKKRITGKQIFLILLIFATLCFIGIYFISLIISKKDEKFDEALELYNLKQYSKAIDLFDEALAEKQLFSSNTDANIKLYKADSYMKLAKYDLAKNTYDELLLGNYSKKDVQEMRDLADALYMFSQGNYSGSLDELIEKSEKWPELYMYIGTCYGEMDDSEKMFSYYEKYVSQFGFNSYIYTQYASYYMSIEDYPTAIGYINNGLESDNEFNAELRLMEIAYYENSQDYQKAYELSCELIDLYPDFEEGVKEYTFLSTRVQ